MSKQGKKIKVSELRLGMHLLRLEGSWLNHPFLRTRFVIDDPNDILRIQEAGIEHVWVDEAPADPEPAAVAAAAQADSLPAVAVESPPVEPKSPPPRAVAAPARSMELDIDRARKLCHAARDQVESMFQEARLGNAIDVRTTLPLVEAIQAEVERNSSAVLSVARLKAHDDYTFMHSVSVCALMVSLARQLGLDAEQARLAGLGGLTHDLGKMFVPLDILNKPGRLTQPEYESMKAHAQAGADALARSNATPEAVDIALHHHEKVSGMGYPHGLKGTDISLFARMGSICDVYDAVTSIRPYKKPWDPAASIREMAKWTGDFDKDVFGAFVKAVGIYPVGSLVRLKTNRLAVVTAPGAGSLLTPKVKVFFSLRSNEPVQTQVIDLASPGCKDAIVGPEDPQRWGFKNLDALWQ